MQYRELKIYSHKKKRKKTVTKSSIAFIKKITNIQKKDKVRRNYSLDLPSS